MDAKEQPTDEQPVDPEFTPSVEMMVHDYDDEKTLDEEEALGSEDPELELSTLKEESELPLEALLAMYGYGNKNNLNSGKSSEHNSEKSDDSKMESEPSELEQLYSDMDDSNKKAKLRPTRVVSKPPVSQPSDDEEDLDYKPAVVLRKSIMVGGAYQAVIPEGLSKYDDSLPYENTDKLIWDPKGIKPEQVVEYLIQAEEISLSLSEDKATIPKGNHTKDDEDALFTLYQCGYNVDEALRRCRLACTPFIEKKNQWSDEECLLFESGLRQCGKDFRQIQQTKVKTRSLDELIKFYYIWKKTDRHDLFSNKARLDKIKYSLRPGMTDYMDRFLEEQEKQGSGEHSGSPDSSNEEDKKNTDKTRLQAKSNDDNDNSNSNKSIVDSLLTPKKIR